MPRAAVQLQARHPRLVAYQHLLRLLASGRAVWTDFLERLPLTLGESAVDRVVTYSASDEVLAHFHQGIDALVEVLKRRRDPAYDRERQSVVLPDARKRVVLWPRRFCPRTLAEDDPLRQVVRLALLETPEFDGGLLESWLSRPAGGAGLFTTLVDVLAKAFETGFFQPAFSGVGLMAHLALLNSLLGAKERIKRVKVKNMGYARLERAVGLALHACLRQAFDTALIRTGRPAAGSPEHTDLMVALVSLGPLAFIAIQDSELSGDINPYGLSPELEQLLLPAYQAALERDNQPHALLRALMREAARTGPLRTSLLQHSSCEAFRRLVLDHLLANEDPAIETDQLLGYCLASNAGILELIENRDLLAQMAADLTERLALRQRQGSAWREMQRLLGMLERLRDNGPPWKQPSEHDELALQLVVERFLLHRLDEFSNEHLRQARRRVVDRRPSADSAGLRKEYEAGRLYRIAADDKPLVRARLDRAEAQLFVDLKGYTRRTAQAKELVMAEFLENEFYQPILEAAKRYRGGAYLVAREQNIELINLLGDAVAFSGNTVSLVQLARDIQHIFRNYRRRLGELTTSDLNSEQQRARLRIAQRREEIRDELAQLEAQLAEIQREVFRRSSLDTQAMVVQLKADFRERFEQLQRNHQALQQQEQATSDRAQRARVTARLTAVRQAHERFKRRREQLLAELKGLEGEALAKRLTDHLNERLLGQVRQIEEHKRTLQEEEHTLEEAEREERQRQGAGLEAGLFIAYGAAAEVIQLDDDVWGLQRVAVSERINEAARGTARNRVVGQRLEERLAAARRVLNRPELELPFRVYIGSTGTFQVEPQLSRMWQQATRDNDEPLIERFLEELGRSVRRRFVQSQRDTAVETLQGSDIYNLGEAISAGALDDYLRQTRNSRFFFRVQVRPEELHQSIRQRFLFTETVLGLIVGSELKDDSGEVEIFRLVGLVLFRGFEKARPTPVFEILRPDSPFVRLLRRHHLEAWMAEAHRDPERKIEGLSPTSLDPEAVGPNPATS